MDSSVPALLMELATKNRETAKLDMEWRQGRRSDALPQNIDSLMDTLEKVVTDNWSEICMTTFETASSSYCSGVRCSLCAPAVLAAGQGCTKSTGKASKDCIRGVFGEVGNCNSCIGGVSVCLCVFLNAMSSFDF